jgi:tol-pal system protein YbgF
MANVTFSPRKARSMQVSATLWAGMSQRLRHKSELCDGGAVARRVAVGAVLAVWLATPAAADEVDDLARQLRQLESTVNQLQRYTYRSGGGDAGQGAAPAATGGGAAALEAGPIAARMNQRITALESEIARLTGTFEEMDFRLRKVEERLDKLIGDVDFRLRALETGAPVAGAAGEDRQAPAPAGTAPEIAATSPPTASPPPGSPPGPPSQPAVEPGQPRVLGSITQNDLQAVEQPSQAAASAPPPTTETQVAAAPAEQPADTAVLPPGSVEEQYKYAFQLLRERQYDAAAGALRAFVAAHGDDRLAGNAQYWLGETYYVRQNYAEAATAFLEGYQRYPDSSKGPDNLLKLGMALSSLGETEQACRSLSQLSTDYPNAPVTITARAETERSKLNCP